MQSFSNEQILWKPVEKCLPSDTKHWCPGITISIQINAFFVVIWSRSFFEYWRFLSKSQPQTTQVESNPVLPGLVRRHCHGATARFRGKSSEIFIMGNLFYKTVVKFSKRWSQLPSGLHTSCMLSLFRFLPFHFTLLIWRGHNQPALGTQGGLP